MDTAELVRLVVTDPIRMREVAAEMLRRTGLELDNAEVSNADRAHCFGVLDCGARALLLSHEAEINDTAAQTHLVGAALGACFAVLDVIDGQDVSGPQAELHARIRQISQIQLELKQERTRYAH